MAALSSLSSALESYRGRDRLVRLGRSVICGPQVGPKLKDLKLRPERGRGRSEYPIAEAQAGLQPDLLAVDI